MNIALNGALGRMGRLVLEAASDASDRVVAIVERPDHPQAAQLVQTPFGALRLLADPAEIPDGVEVGLDFSTPAAAVAFAESLARRGIPVVVGTTGLPPDAMPALRAASQHAPILWAANMSLGVFCLHEMAALARRVLGPSYDVEIIEVHHRHKRDAPSGTALSLARALDPDSAAAWKAGREGDVGPRPAVEIGIHAVRGGEVVGEHTVLFLGPHDRIEITHRASSRRLFAEGALHLARRLVARGPGLYGVRDLLQTSGAAAPAGRGS